MRSLKPPLYAAIERRRKILFNDLLVLLVAFVLLSLLEQLTRFAECLLGGLLMLGTELGESGHHFLGSPGKLKMVAERKETIDPGTILGLANERQILGGLDGCLGLDGMV